MRLVRDTVSRDLIEAFELLNHAMASKSITGIVFGCTIRGGRRYFVNVAGILASDPTLARGVVAALEDELRAMVHDQADGNTTFRGKL